MSAFVTTVFGKRRMARRILATAMLGVLHQQCMAISAYGDRFDQDQPSGGPGGIHYNVAEVTSCADDGSPGTLRWSVANTADPAEMDLTHLTCSTITLDSGEIEVPQNYLFVYGGSHTIDAQLAGRAFHQTGSVLFLADHITIENGLVKYSQAQQDADGGCILSNAADVTFDNVTLDDCHAVNLYSNAAGGAVDAAGGRLTMSGSTISNSGAYGLNATGGGARAYADMYVESSIVTGNEARARPVQGDGYARGGGIYGHAGVGFYNVALSNNSAIAEQGLAFGGGVVANDGIYNIAGSVSIIGNSAVSPLSSAGGFATRGNGYLYGALVAYNQAVDNSAGVILPSLNGPPGMTQIVDSTISSNTSTSGSSALFATEPVYLLACTIAFNNAAGTSAGVYLYPGGNATIVSTIISNNTSTGGGIAYDLVSRATITGDHDLIVSASAVLPSDTLRVDPQLQPLMDNGGSTRTHALIAGSPAIDSGRQSRPYIQWDQRLQGYPRVSGASADIGAFELQVITDPIFGNGFDP